jgi:hypothetical protein
VLEEETAESLTPRERELLKLLKAQSDASAKLMRAVQIRNLRPADGVRPERRIDAAMAEVSFVKIKVLVMLRAINERRPPPGV